jgi:TonB family protein
MKIQDITEGYGKYYCSTDKKWKTRKGPKQTRKVSEDQGVAEGLDAEEYKQKLLSSLPQMMRFYEKNVQGWKPSEEQMLAAVETGYTVMKHTGDVKQAGKAVMDELNTLHRMSQGQQGVAEGSLEEVDRRGFLKGLGAAAVAGAAGSAIAGERETAVEAITKIAGTAWDMRRLGWSRSQAMTAFENQMGFKGELLRVAGIVCNFAWSVPKDHFTRNEFIQQVRAQSSKNLPSTSNTTSQDNSRSIRQSNLDRMRQMAEPSASYAGRIKARIMPNITGQSAGPVAVEIRSRPDGTIISSKLLKSSGNAEWDLSVLKGIDKTEVLPRDTDGRVPSTITVNIGESDEQGVAEEKQRLDPKCWDGYKKDGTKMKGGVRVNNCVKEDSLEEYGDTAQGQKMLTKVQKRAVDRVVSKRADTDPAYAKKNKATADRAWERMANKDLEETYDGDEFFEAYGELWYNEDEQLDEAKYQGRNVPLGKPMQGDVKKFKVYVKDPSTGNVKKVNFGDPDMKIRKSNPAARRSFRARHNCDNPGPRTKARFWSCRKW